MRKLVEKMDFLKKIGKDIIINETEINTLKRYNIDVLNCNTIDEVLLLIDRFLDDTEVLDEEYEELDYIANNLSERKYYGTTNK